LDRAEYRTEDLFIVWRGCHNPAPDAADRKERPLSRIEQQMQFILEIDRMKTIYRRNYLTDGSRRENDAEHSWHLAVMAMLLAEDFEGTDTLRVVKMVLIHDLVELYAGDTFLYDEKGNSDKARREQESADRLFPMLPPDQAKEFRSLWEEFEERKTPDARAAAVLDRIHPFLLNTASGGKSWKEHGIRLHQVLRAQQEALDAAPPALRQYFLGLIRRAEEEHLLAE